MTGCRSGWRSSYWLITPYYERARRFLIEDVRQMRDDEFERLYEAEAQGLFGFLAYRTGDRALAEDLLADTFERALRSRKRFDRRRGLGQDVAVRDRAEPAARPRAARRPPRAGRSSASAPRRAGAVGRSATPSSTATSSSARSPALSPEEREAIALRFGAELTVPEIAEALREPLTTVEGRVYRALRKLRGELAE